MTQAAGVVAFLLVALIALAFFQYLAFFFPAFRDPRAREVVDAWILLLSVSFATFIVLRAQSLPWSVVGLDPPAASPRLLVTGAMLGAGTIGLASLGLFALDMLQITPTKPGSSLAAAGRYAAILLPAAFFEELFVRGYLFAILRRTAGWKMALIATSVVFGLMHLGNPGADAESVLAVTVAGFFLGVILLATRSLYAAGAAHFAWNWVMAGGLHIAVSGLPTKDPDYRTVETGPDWVTGGAWGPEGGIAAVVVMFIVIFYLYGRYLRRMEWRA